MDHSQVMETLSYLTDVIGPRLTSSPNLKRANEWTRDRLASWGLQNAHLEAWGPFGRGWSLQEFSAQVVEPQCIPLIAFPKAWSPGTEGGVVADVVLLDAEKEEDLARFEGKLGGKVVLLGAEKPLKAWFEPPGDRLDEKELLELANSAPPEPRANRFRGRRRGGRDARGRMAFFNKRNELLLKEKPAVLVEPSGIGDGGTLFVASAQLFGQNGKRVWDKDVPETIPQVVCSIEHFNRLVRMIKQGESLRMAMNLKVGFHDNEMNHNTVAEIPGTDLKDQLVMLGGHLDSWHSGTGATDNAAGVSVCMEAVRILQKAGLKPRRTIRVVLWTGEEQGLLGSRAYVKEHFGAVDANTGDDAVGARLAALWGNARARTLRISPEYEQLSAYYNLDNGTGKIRGVYLEGNEAVRPLFRSWLAPFTEDGASTLTPRPTGGTDHMSFDAIGLPGFQFIQDPIEYNTRTHHSNQDVYERLQSDDLKQAAVIMAFFLYQTAQRDELMPRKPLPDSLNRVESSSESPKLPAPAAAAGGE